MDHKLDEHDLAIVRNLWDGRMPYADIAEKVGLTTNTVRNRVNRMAESGALQIIGLVNPAAVDGTSSAFIGFNVLPSKADTALRQIQGMKNMVGAATVSGRFDIMGIFMFNEEFSHERFLKEELKNVDGLQSVETFFVIGGSTFQLRYVL